MDPIARAAARSSVSECRRCHLHSVGSGPVPFRGDASNGIVVVGEAPGKTEDLQRKPFVGPSGQLAEQTLELLGVDVAKLGWINGVSCFPDRTPTGDEIRACKPNMVSQLTYLQPKYLLVFGGISFRAVAPDDVKLRMGEARGLWWEARGTGNDPNPWAMATWHPSAILRNNKLKDEWLRDLEMFTIIAGKGMTPPVNQFCAKCDDYAEEFVYEFPFCEKHIPKTKKLGRHEPK